MNKTMNENFVEKIVHDANFSYSNYKCLICKYWETDWREIIFQNRVVTPLLDKLFINEKDISIIDISTQSDRNDTDIHNTRFYKKEKTASPDLLVARHWNYANKNNAEIDYLAVVEVKSPKLDPIFNNKNDFNGRLKTYLEANDKVILTDCIKWEFFEKDLVPVKTINLFDEINNLSRKVGKIPEFLTEELQSATTYEGEPQEWIQLCEYLREFLTRN